MSVSYLSGMQKKGEIMEKEYRKELYELTSCANDNFLELIAILEILNDIEQFDNINCSVISLTQSLTKKAFKQMNDCKKLLNLI